MTFFVDKVYYLPHRDLLVLAGRPQGDAAQPPLPGGRIDLPEEIKGPGWVPIADVQTVAFEDGTDRLCVVLDYEVVVPTPLMEFRDLEGRALEVRRP
ncbi:MAG: hypothetical protein KTR31_07130 [Myxococcales bacterium]|nr:hypothetical protein [Myxococcales bacterium]